MKKAMMINKTDYKEVTLCQIDLQ